MREALAADEGAAHRMVRTAESRPQDIGELLGQIVHRDGAEALAVIGLQAAISDAAEPVPLFQDRVEYRSKLARRAVDHLQDLRGGGLLLECFARLGDEPR